MKIRVFIVLLMTLWDFSLHAVEILSLAADYPLYITFPFYGITYDVFWAIYWGVASIILFSTLFYRKREHLG